jgi:hypothetical protein
VHDVRLQVQFDTGGQRAMEPRELFDDYLEDTIYDEKQVAEEGVHLTADRILAVRGGGDTDFGGDEHRPSDLQVVRPEKRDPEDDYGWWELAGETVLLEYNERLTGSVRARLEPRRELLERGASHPTVTVESLGRVPLSVPAAGLALKENARVSTLRLAPNQ